MKAIRATRLKKRKFDFKTIQRLSEVLKRKRRKKIGE